jgi:inhibitor of KinA
VRVLTIGFAPGQPYLGVLPERWDVPRQSALTSSVPEGALVTAIRQLIVFTAATPTGWRHIGQTAFRGFRPESDTPFALHPGDELQFAAISGAELDQIRMRDTSGNGGAEIKDIS